MAEIGAFSTDQLLSELLSRQDELVKPGGFLDRKAFALADQLSTRVCVDGAPVRQNKDGDVEMMAIKRGTGPYAGKLCLVGGGVQRVEEKGLWVPESTEEALKRHFKTDLGCDIEPVGTWDQPHYLAQDMRPIDGEVRPGFMPNPASRHLVAARYLVEITDGADGMVFGETELGGQEALGVEWFGRDTMPGPDAFGYNHGETYRKMLPIAEQLNAQGAITATA